MSREAIEGAGADCSSTKRLVVWRLAAWSIRYIDEAAKCEISNHAVRILLEASVDKDGPRQRLRTFQFKPLERPLGISQRPTSGEDVGGENSKGAGMPNGRDVNLGRRGAGSTTKKNAFCSFCRKSYRDVGPLVEGPGDVYICGECIELCQSILDQERRRRGTSKQLFTRIPTPREIVDAARRIRHRPRPRRRSVLAVAVHSHYKRLTSAAEGDSTSKLISQTSCSIGPTGSRQNAAGPHAGPQFSTCRSPSATPPR